MLYVVLVVIGLALIGGLFYILRARSQRAGVPTEAAAGEHGFRPVASDFHVAGGDAHVTFEVPLPEGEPDPVLSDILLREAVEVLRAKRSHLPLQGVSRVHAHARRNGATVEVGSLRLDGPGELPPPADPSEHPFSAGRIARDVFEDLGGEGAERPEVAVRTPQDELAPLGDELRLTGLMETGLRTQGVDPRQSSFHDLVAAMLHLAGYTTGGDTGTSFTATKAGVTHYIELVDHGLGDHPELSERAVAAFIGRFTQSGAARGLLFSPKYAPFAIYDRERREPRVRFVTRERFQGFVDALSFG